MLFRILAITALMFFTYSYTPQVYAQTDDCFDGCFDDDGNLIPPDNGDSNDGGSNGDGDNDQNDGGDGNNDQNDGGDGNNDQNDGGSNGDGNNDQGDAPDNNTDDDDDEKLTADLEPFLYLQFESHLEEVNLTPHDYNHNFDGSVEYYKENPNYENLIYKDYSQGIQVTRTYLMKWGVGAKVRWHFENADGFKDDIFAYVGAAPINGTEIISRRQVPGPEAADKLKSIKRPAKNLKEIRDWAVGDKLSHIRSGGVVFKAGVGYKFIDIGYSVVNEGQWRVIAEKVDTQNAIVTVENMDVEQSMVSLSAGMARLGQGQIETEGESFSFRLDLNSGLADKAYDDIVNGNVAGVQEFLKNNYTTDIEFIQDYEMSENGRISSFSVGLPFLFKAFWGKGEFLGVAERNLHVFDQRVKSNYGVYREKSGYKFFGNSKNHSLVFYGNHFQTYEDDKAAQDGFYGEFVMSFKRNNMSYGKLLKDIAKMSELLTMNEELMVNVPRDKDLGYVEAKMRIKLPQKLVGLLMKRAKSEPMDDLVNESMSFIEHSDLSQVSGYEFNVQGQIDPQFFGDSKKAIKKMFKSLRDMRKYKNINSKKFTKSFAKFGKYALKNEKTFENFLRLAGEDYHVDYYLRGEEFSQYSLRLSPQGNSKYKTVVIEPEL